jgi:hypothetical protein
MDKRAQDILDAGRAVLPQLREMLGEAGAPLEAELRTAVDRAEKDWHAEIVRDILRRYPQTRAFLEDRVAEAKDPRPLDPKPIFRRPD